MPYYPMSIAAVLTPAIAADNFKATSGSYGGAQPAVTATASPGGFGWG